MKTWAEYAIGDVVGGRVVSRKVRRPAVLNGHRSSTSHLKAVMFLDRTTPRAIQKVSDMVEVPQCATKGLVLKTSCAYMNGGNIRYTVGAKYPLDRVFDLVPDAHIGGKQRDDVCRELGCNQQHALKYIRQKLRGLTSSCFHERKAYGGAQQDVYRVSDVVEGESLIWYVKISIVEPDRLVVNSFHIAEYEM